MSNPILEGFKGLGRFSGRQGRGAFWPYAGVVIAVVFICAAIGMSIAMGGLFTEMQAFATAHPEASRVQASPGSYSIEIDASHPDAPVPDLRPFFGVMWTVVLMAVILLAAAVSRRLHDSNRSALWGLIPVVFLATGLTLFPVMMADVMEASEPNPTWFALLIANNMIYMVSLVGLIVLLALPGTAGVNRHGPPTS